MPRLPCLSGAGYTERMTLKKWTCAEYQRLADLGILQPHDKLELIEGDIVEMSPQNLPTAMSVTHATSILVYAYSLTHYVRVQLPLNVGMNSQPEPDFAVVLKGVVDGASTHPQKADLVVEVSESSLAFDRREKMLIYGAGGLPEYWIINVIDGVLEVHRDPDSKIGYRSRQFYKKEDHVTALFAPEVQISVATLF